MKRISEKAVEEKQVSKTIVNGVAFYRWQELTAGTKHTVKEKMTLKSSVKLTPEVANKFRESLRD